MVHYQYNMIDKKKGIHKKKKLYKTKIVSNPPLSLPALLSTFMCQADLPLVCSRAASRP